MMVFTACAMAFAHGSNDVANGIGPMAAVVSIIDSGGQVGQKAALPLWILLMGGVGIVIGLATMGYKVMQTIGTKITERRLPGASVPHWQRRPPLCWPRRPAFRSPPPTSR